MKKVTVFLCSLALVFSVVGVAGAVSYTWIDCKEFDHKYLDKDFSYTHDITTHGFQSILRGGDDLIYNYSVEIALVDDTRGTAKIDLPGILTDKFYSFNYVSQTFGWSVAGLYSLNQYGLLEVNIDHRKGNYYLDYSKLVAKGCNGSGAASVPEPSTILLMGAGLLGLVAVGRRKFNRKE